MRRRDSISSIFRFSFPNLLFQLTFFSVLCSISGPAQIDRAVLEGAVTDQTGAAIVGATVKVVAAETDIGQETQTNSNGYYRFPGLPVGSYSITVSSSNFRTQIIKDVRLRIGQTRTLNVPLAVGGADEKMEVSAITNPADKSSPEASTVIDSAEIANLPNNGRDWASFTLLAPFAQDDGGGDQRTIRFAGRARDDNNFMFDGVDAGGIQEQAQKSQTRLQVSQDAIEEYRVNSALYDVEYGTQAGGQVNIVTKSGTNNFHGTLFGYLRNSIFDARNFNDFDVNGNPAIPPFRMGQYGLTVGGPIQKDKTFFFVSYEGLRQYQSTTQQFLVPSGIAPPGGGPSFQQQVLNTSPQMCEIMRAYPWRQSAGTINGCTPLFVYPDAAFQQTTSVDPNADLLTAATPTVVHEDTWLIRLDHKLSDKTLLYGRAQRDISLVDAPNGGSLPGDKLQTINHPANYVVAVEHTFTPSLFNEVKGYINRSPYHNPQASALPFSVDTSSNFVTLNNNTADIEIGTTFGIVDNLSWNRGRHTFKMGMEIRRVRLNQGQTDNNTLTFASEASMVAGSVDKIDYIAPWCCHGLRRMFYMPYFQDEWKATPTLTITAGVRWEYYGVAHEATNRTTIFLTSISSMECVWDRVHSMSPPVQGQSIRQPAPRIPHSTNPITETSIPD